MLPLLGVYLSQILTASAYDKYPKIISYEYEYYTSKVKYSVLVYYMSNRHHTQVTPLMLCFQVSPIKTPNSIQATIHAAKDFAFCICRGSQPLGVCYSSGRVDGAESSVGYDLSTSTCTYFRVYSYMSRATHALIPYDYYYTIIYAAAQYYRFV